jgi:tetratricopeptide (TPR) repeat protein
MRPRDVPANDAPAAARNAAQIGAARSAADALMQQGRYADAVAGYRRLLKLDPASAAVRINLATALLATRKPDKAAHYMLEAFQLIPEALGRYDHVVAILYSLRPELKRAIDWTMHAWPARLSLREIAVHVSLGALATDAFLLWVLESHTICKLGLERFFTCLRAGFVAAIAEGPAPDRDFATIAMPLCCAIARQNFLNDYLFATEPLEVARASRLRAEIERALTTGEAVAPLAVAACAMYVPLGTLAGAATLIARNFAPPLAGVVRQQVIEPRDEQADRADIAQLTPIVGATSNEAPAL